jgi:ABC-type antimicrobial peptide transport system permease subunit
MAPEMRGVLDDQTAFWVPFERIISSISLGNISYEQLRARTSLNALARLSPGASAAAVASDLERHYVEANDEMGLQPGYQLAVVKGIVRNIGVHREAERQLRMFLVGSVLLAFVAAANVSLFLLARAPGRRRELAIRMSVGAPLARIARQLANEAGLLVIVSAVLGLISNLWLVNFLRGLAFLREANWTKVTLFDWKVLISVGLFLVVVAMLVTLAPILGLRRFGLASSSREVAARATLSQRLAGNVQIAVAGALGGAAIAFAWYFYSMVFGNPGYELEDRYFVRFDPEFVSDSLQKREIIEALPGVRAMTLTSAIPGRSSSISTRPLRHAIDPTRQVSVGNSSIDGRFVDVLGLHLLYGRAPSDNQTGVALVNQSFANQMFGREDVVGESLDLTGFLNYPRMEIAGVLADVSLVHPDAIIEPMLFIKGGPAQFRMLGIINSPLPGAELRRELQTLIDSGVLETNTVSVTPLKDLRNNLIAADRARALLTIATASLVVLLATIGYYGTQRYLVAAGRREYAIRASLGAGPRALGRLVFLRGLSFSLPGLIAAVLLAFIVVAWLRDNFTSREIPPISVAVIVAIGLTTLLLAANVGPARHAKRAQPAFLLRED